MFPARTPLPASAAISTTSSEDDFVKEVVTIIKRKQSGPIDFQRLLQANMRTYDVTKVQDEDGNHVLHLCLIHNRLVFLRVIFNLGLFSLLIDQVVVVGASSEYAGCTAYDVAERKRLRRYKRELDTLRALELDLEDNNGALKDCRAGSYEQVTKHRPQDLLCGDVEGSTAVHWACINGTPQLLKYLVETIHCDVNVTNNIGQTPLHIAVACGQSSLINYLVTVGNLDPFAQEKSGENPIQITAENGDMESLSELLRCGVPLERDLLLKAAQHGRCDYMKHVIAIHGMNAYHRESTTGKTCLMIAAENDHLETVRYLLDNYHFKLEEVTLQNRNIFHYVADKGRTEVAELLMEDANSKGQDLQPLLNKKDLHNFEQLCTVVRGVDKGKPMWHYVKLERRSVQLSQKRIKGGRIDVNQVGTILGSGWGEDTDAETNKELIQKYRARHHTQDGEPDLTPLTLAVAKGHPEVARLYLDAGSIPEGRDCFGQNILHLAAMRGLVGIAEQVPNRSVLTREKDDAGFTALDTAKHNEHDEMIAFLQQPVQQDCEPLVQVSFLSN